MFVLSFSSPVTPEIAVLRREGHANAPLYGTGSVCWKCNIVSCSVCDEVLYFKTGNVSEPVFRHVGSYHPPPTKNCINVDKELM